MKKLLFTLLASSFCFLGAMEKETITSDEQQQYEQQLYNKGTTATIKPFDPAKFETIFALSAVPSLSPSDYKKITMQNGDEIIQYGNTGYPTMVKVIWEHGEGLSESLTIKYIGEFTQQLFLSNDPFTYVHVPEKPKNSEEWAGVLWKHNEIITKTVNEHRYLDETYSHSGAFNAGLFKIQFQVPLPFKGKPFRIYGNNYELDLQKLVH